jgi:hypothetical protein
MKLFGAHTSITSPKLGNLRNIGSGKDYIHRVKRDWDPNRSCFRPAGVECHDPAQESDAAISPAIPAAFVQRRRDG